tara:strand:+ start:448 stop:675 length:228 start_codon:yes stop_codon:yes gene_type:complete
MEHHILKIALGVDVSKENLAVCLCRLTVNLTKDFETPFEVSNDISGFKKLIRWLDKQVADRKDLLGGYGIHRDLS